MAPPSKKIFAFDVGKASLGICVRDGANILELESLLIPPEYANTQDLAKRRRAYRTRQAHKKREAWLVQKWQEAGLVPLTNDDGRLKREFPERADDTLYNSALLRIALLQESPLEEWQIFKALRASIQHRGYDSNCDWQGEDESGDEKENLESSQQYIEKLYFAINSQEAYAYPCYLEASLMGLWHWERPEQLYPRITHKIGIQEDTGKVRDKGRVAPRKLVEKEIRQLFDNAKKQLPQLGKINTDEFLYGPAGKPYASLSPEYAEYRGSEWDAQGVLSQKVPRFDNRIINKCQLLPKRNVCKAKEELYLKFVLMTKLKNLRFTDEDGVYNRGFTPEEFRKAFELAWENYTGKKSEEMTYGVIKKIAEKATGMRLNLLNMKEREKYKINASGRARFCRPALKLLTDVLLSGENPSSFDLTPYIQSESLPNPITREELKAAVLRLGESWEKFHIGDTRYESLKESQHLNPETLIHRLIGEVNNPVVRHRLTVFFNNLKRMTQEHGKADRVILEFVRGGEGLEGQKTASDWEKHISENEARNDTLRKKLLEADIDLTRSNLLKLQLLEEQQSICPYSGEKISISNLSECDIDHIVPITNEVACDARYNKVLCKFWINRDKGNKTPFEWLSNTPAWSEFLERVTNKNTAYGKKKRELLTRSDSRELVESYNALAETAYVARLTRRIVSIYYGWGEQTQDENRRVFVNDGKITALIRRKYNMNELLLTNEEKQELEKAGLDVKKQRKVWEKNRKNPKHHALDAYCISYSQQIHYYQDDMGNLKTSVPGLMESKAEFEKRLHALFPKTAVQRNTKELYPMETIYGYKKIHEHGKVFHCLTVRKNLTDFLIKDRKKIKDILDIAIRNDLEQKSNQYPENKAWVEFLKGYTHPTRKSLVKSVVIIESKTIDTPEEDHDGRLVFGEYKDFGSQHNGNKGVAQKQFKHSKQHKGQIIFFDEKGIPRVFPLYAHQSKNIALNKLKEKNLRVYANGEIFYSGCTIEINQPLHIKQKEYPPGQYKLRTIMTSGTVILETSQGERFPSRIGYLVDAGLTKK